MKIRPNSRLGQPDYKMEHKDLIAFVVDKNVALRQVTAIVSVFGVRDMMDDIIHPGAYVKTIVERTGKIRVLDNHRTDSIMAGIGRPVEIREVGRDQLPPALLAEFPEATGGLLTVTQFDDTPEGNGAFDRIVSGTINEWSIGFDVLSYDKTTVKNADGKSIVIRNIREIRLWEYSAVLWGANQATWTVDAKGAHQSESDQTMPNPTSQRSQADAPNYREAPAGHDRCSTCFFFDADHRCRQYDFTADPDFISDSYKPGNAKAGDTPEETRSVEGVEETIGSYLIFRVYASFTDTVNSWLACNNITIQEHRILTETGGKLLDFLTAEMPTDIMEREEEEYDPFSSMMFWAADGAQLIKRLSNHEGKAGRVLSKSNATKLVSAVNEINTVLTDAGIFEEAQEGDDTEGKSQPTQTEAGSSPVTPTLSKDDEIAASVKKMRDEIKSSQK